MLNVEPSRIELDVARYNTIGILTSTDHKIGIQYIFDTFGQPVNLDRDNDNFRNEVYQRIAELISIHQNLKKNKKSRIKPDPREYARCVNQLLESIVTPDHLKYVEIALAVAVNYGSQYIVRDIFNALDKKKLKIDLKSYNFLRIGCYPHYMDEKRNKDFEKCSNLLLMRGCDPNSSEYTRFGVVNRNAKNPLKQFVRKNAIFCLQQSTSPTMSFMDVVKRSLKMQNFPSLSQSRVKSGVDILVCIKPKSSSSLTSAPAWSDGRVTIEILKNAVNVNLSLTRLQEFGFSKSR